VLAVYIGWLVWGTGILTSHAQHALRQDIIERIQHPRVTLTLPPGGSTGTAAAPAVRIPEPRVGQPVGILRIPRIKVDFVVVEGTNPDNLTKGPGHYPGTAFPWEDHGRVAIAGHRTTYARPFWSLDALRVGDLIEIQTEFGTFRYRVSAVRDVLPTALWVSKQTGAPSLVLTTCTPRWSASHRLAVFAQRE
jgi:sortase A